MSHQEYVRIVPGADTAVLLIHGIVGTPNHFRDLIPLAELVPEDWSVYNLLLDGHGKTMDDFAASSMAKWKGQVRSIFEALSESHDRVILVAHSMGTLFALQLAVEYPEKVPFLFLLGVPLRPGVRLTMMRDCVMMTFGILPQDHVLWKAAGVTTTRKLWKYLKWIPRFLELFREIARTEKYLPLLNVPCITFQSRRDELVMNWTRCVLEKYAVMEVEELLHSSHFYYHPEEQELVQQEFLRRCKEITHD